MLHNQANHDLNGGHWAANRSSDGIGVLVQVGDIGEAHQTRLKLRPASALHLAADLLTAADKADEDGSLQIGGEDMPWEIWRMSGRTTLTLRPDRHRGS